MDYDFLCPKCKGHLRVGNNIIFTTKTKKWKGGLILMHPELGNYKFEHHPSFSFEEGQQIDFYCPICMDKLTSKRHDNLAKVIMRDENRVECEILFSRIAGEKSTYKIIGETMEVFGEQSSTYIDYINLSQMF